MAVFYEYENKTQVLANDKLEGLTKLEGKKKNVWFIKCSLKVMSYLNASLRVISREHDMPSES